MWDGCMRRTRKDRGLADCVTSAAGWAPVLALCTVLLFIEDAAAGDWHVTLPSETNGAMHPPRYPDCPSWTDQSPPKWQYDCKAAMSGADGRLSLPYNSNLPHLSKAPDAFPATPKLTVFLPGTTNNPGQFASLLEALSRSDQHVIGLMYQSSPYPDEAASELCWQQPDGAKCLADFHSDILFGGDASGFWNVSTENSIVSRLRSLLGYLAAHYPEEGWQSFLLSDGQGSEQGRIDWNKVTLAGFSQGASHVGFAAKELPLARAVMISGPQDLRKNGADCADFWTSRDPKTPASRQFGIVNRSERYRDLIRDNWRRMGMLSEDEQPADIGDGLSLTFVATTPQGLITDLLPVEPASKACGPRWRHCSMAMEVLTPKVTTYAIPQSGPGSAKHDAVPVSVYAQFVWPYLQRGANPQ
jgi:hypothetical protein